MVDILGNLLSSLKTKVASTLEPMQSTFASMLNATQQMFALPYDEYTNNNIVYRRATLEVESKAEAEKLINELASVIDNIHYTFADTKGNVYHLTTNRIQYADPIVNGSYGVKVAPGVYTSTSGYDGDSIFYIHYDNYNEDEKIIITYYADYYIDGAANYHPLWFDDEEHPMNIESVVQLIGSSVSIYDVYSKTLSLAMSSALDLNNFSNVVRATSGQLSPDAQAAVENIMTILSNGGGVVTVTQLLKEKLIDLYNGATFDEDAGVIHFNTTEYNVDATVSIGITQVLTTVASFATAILSVFGGVIGAVVGGIGTVISHAVEAISNDSSHLIEVRKDSGHYGWAQPICQSTLDRTSLDANLLSLIDNSPSGYVKVTSRPFTMYFWPSSSGSSKIDMEAYVNCNLKWYEQHTAGSGQFQCVLPDVLSCFAVSTSGQDFVIDYTGSSDYTYTYFITQCGTTLGDLNNVDHQDIVDFELQQPPANNSSANILAFSCVISAMATLAASIIRRMYDDGVSSKTWTTTADGILTLPDFPKASMPISSENDAMLILVNFIGCIKRCVWYNPNLPWHHYQNWTSTPLSPLWNSMTDSAIPWMMITNTIVPAIKYMLEAHADILPRWFGYMYWASIAPYFDYSTMLSSRNVSFSYFSSNFENPYVIPPSHVMNMMSRSLMTIAAVVVTATAVAATSVAISKRVKFARMKQRANLEKLDQAFMANPSYENFNKYRKAAKQYNIIGKLTDGYGWSMKTGWAEEGSNAAANSLLTGLFGDGSQIQGLLTTGDQYIADRMSTSSEVSEVSQAIGALPTDVASPSDLSSVAESLEALLMQIKSMIC